MRKPRPPTTEPKAAGAKKATASTGAKRLASVIARACAHSRPVGLLKFGEQGAGDVALAQYVEDSLLPAHTVYSEGSFWVYTGMRWEIIPLNQLEGLVEQINRKEYIAEGGQPPKRLSLGDRRVQSIINRLRSRLSRGREDFFKDAPAGINCANGFVTFGSDGNPTVIDHSPDHRQRHVLAGRWEPEKGTAPIRDALRVNFRDGNDAEDKIRLEGQAIAVGLLGLGGQRNSRVVLLVGDSDSGKSTFLDIVSHALPDGSHTAVPPELWGNPNSRFDLVGKAANLVAELTDSKPIPENYLKMGVSGDACPVKKLFRDTETVRLRVQNIWATNPTTMPVIAGGMGARDTEAVCNPYLQPHDPQRRARRWG